MYERYIVKSPTGSLCPCVTERQALQKAAELFDKHGPQAEIEIYLNDLSAEALLYSRVWLQQWNEHRIKHG